MFGRLEMTAKNRPDSRAPRTFFSSFSQLRELSARAFRVQVASSIAGCPAGAARAWGSYAETRLLGRPETRLACVRPNNPLLDLASRVFPWFGRPSGYVPTRPVHIRCWFT